MQIRLNYADKSYTLHVLDDKLEYMNNAALEAEIRHMVYAALTCFHERAFRQNHLAALFELELHALAEHYPNMKADIYNAVERVRKYPT